MLVSINEILGALYRRQLDAGALTEAAYVVLTATCQDAETPCGHPGPEEEIVDGADSLSADVFHADSIPRRAA
jgi:hypothetical protein